MQSHLKPGERPWGSEDLLDAAVAGAEVRLNPLWMPLSAFTAEVYLPRPGVDWIYVVLRSGEIFVGSEDASPALSSSDIARLLAGIQRTDPSLTEADVRAALDGLGHPTVGPDFDTADVVGRTVVAPGRIAGELTRDPETGVWKVNDKSGRYMGPKPRPGTSASDIERWLRNVAQRLADHLGEPVRPVLVKPPTRIVEVNTDLWEPLPGTIDDPIAWEFTSAGPYGHPSLRRADNSGVRTIVRYQLRATPNRWSVLLKVHLRPLPGVEAEQLEQVKQAASAAVKSMFKKPKHKLLVDGLEQTLRVKLEFVGSPGEAHAVIDVAADDPQTDMTQQLWVVGRPPQTFAHEVGHWLGIRHPATQNLPPPQDCADTRRWRPTHYVGDGLMQADGRGHGLTPAELAQFVDVALPYVGSATPNATPPRFVTADSLDARDTSPRALMTAGSPAPGDPPTTRQPDVVGPARVATYPDVTAVAVPASTTDGPLQSDAAQPTTPPSSTASGTCSVGVGPRSVGPPLAPPALPDVPRVTREVVQASVQPPSPHDRLPKVTHEATVDFFVSEGAALWARTLYIIRVAFRASWLKPEVAGGPGPVRLTVPIFLDTTELKEELAKTVPSSRLDDEVARLRHETVDATLSAAAQKANVGHRLPDGARLLLDIQFVETRGDALHVVHLKPTGRTFSNDWMIGRPGVMYLHEVLHLLVGLLDEYREYTTRGTRAIYVDGGIMGGPPLVAVAGLTVSDTDRDFFFDVVRPDVRLMPRDLRKLGAVVARAGSRVGAPVEAPRVKFADGVLEAVLDDALRRPPPGHGGQWPPATVDRKPNGVYRDHRGPGTLDDIAVGSRVDWGWRYPVEWTTDEVRYHVEQAFLDAVHHGWSRGPGLPVQRVDLKNLGRQWWVGEYNGVRSEGQVLAGEIVWFQPAADQRDVSEIHAPVLHPLLMSTDQRPQPRRQLMAHDIADMMYYGKRGPRTGMFHQITRNTPGFSDKPGVEHIPGVRVERVPNTTLDNGTYLARVWFLDPRINPSKDDRARIGAYWHPPFDSNGNKQRMFPETRTSREVWADIVQAWGMAEAFGYVRRNQDGTTTWVGTGGGVRIMGTNDEYGRIIAARPTAEQPPPATTSAKMIASGPGMWLGDAWRSLRLYPMLLVDHPHNVQIGYHLARPVRLVADVGTTTETMNRVRSELLDRYRPGAIRPDRGTGRWISTGLVEVEDPDPPSGWAVDVTVHPDGSWSAPGRARAPRQALSDLLPMANNTAAKLIDGWVSNLPPGMGPLRKGVVQHWEQTHPGPDLDQALALLRAAHPVPDGPVWPVRLADITLPSLRPPTDYDDQLKAALDEAAKYLDRTRMVVLAGPDEQTYLARPPWGGPEVMFPRRWTRDDVRLAAAHILRKSPTSQAGPEHGTARWLALPGLPVKVKVRTTPDGLQVDRIRPTRPAYLTVRKVPAHHRALLPPAAHQPDTLAFALTQIVDHPVRIQQVEVDKPAPAYEYLGEYGGVRALVLISRQRVKYRILSQDEYDAGVEFSPATATRHQPASAPTRDPGRPFGQVPRPGSAPPPARQDGSDEASATNQIGGDTSDSTPRHPPLVMREHRDRASQDRRRIGEPDSGVVASGDARNFDPPLPQAAYPGHDQPSAERDATSDALVWWRAGELPVDPRRVRQLQTQWSGGLPDPGGDGRLGEQVGDLAGASYWWRHRAGDGRTSTPGPGPGCR